MSRRSKESTEYYKNRMLKLFAVDSKYKSVKHRYDTLKLLLQEKYPFIKENDIINLLKDTIYLDRELRLYTADLEIELKRELAQEKQVELFIN